MLKLQNRTLDWSLKHIEEFGDTDIFPKPFEIDAIRAVWDTDLKSNLLDLNILDHTISPLRKCLTPKQRLGFRPSTQLDPIDTLIFNGLIYEIGQDIENSRIPKSEQIAFSYRFLPNADGLMFDKEFTWFEFQARSKELAESDEYEFVLITDIADFYPRIYSHPLENALKECTSRTQHATSISKMINSINHSISSGIPVGCSGSRLLAELVLDDIDRGLITEATIHTRYVDDFRIFCKTKKEAYEKLSLMAQLLHENHSLTLQQQKTEIITKDEFLENYFQTESKIELDSLSQQFRTIIEHLGLNDNPYAEIEYEECTDDVKEEIDNLNLIELLKEQIEKGDELNIQITKFVLKRLGQLNNAEGISIVLENIDILYPVFKESLVYLTTIRNLSEEKKHEYGELILGMLDNSISCHLDFHRMWILNTFTRNNEWDNESKFAQLYNESTDEYSKRKLTLALGRSGNNTWFKSRKRNVDNLPPWERRAFLAAASCLPGDEYRHWIRSISSRLTLLEKAVCKWANSNNFGG